MKKLMLLFLLFGCGCSSAVDGKPEMCDIIFQTSKSSQSDAIAEISGSDITHVGIIVIQNNKPFVLEASSTVKFTPLDLWIANGRKNKYHVKRLKNSSKLLTSKVQLEMFKAANKYFGKNYDVMFQWSDDTIYCSELVWKVFYFGAGIELCKIKTFKDYRLDGKLAKSLIEKRYNGIINRNEKVVAPVDIYNSDFLFEVNY